MLERILMMALCVILTSLIVYLLYTENIKREKLELERFENRGSDIILYLKNNKSFRGGNYVWHSWPDGGSVSHDMKDKLEAIHTKVKWDLADTKDVVES
jgi:hypothetical protein